MSRHDIRFILLAAGSARPTRVGYVLLPRDMF